AKLLRHDLGEGRLVSLPLAADPELEDRFPGRMDAQLRGVEHPQPGDVVVLAGAGADHLGKAGDADPHQLTLLAFLRLLLAEVLVADLLERQPQRLLVLAAVILEPGRRLVGELVGLDEVLDSKVRGILTQLDRRRLDRKSTRLNSSHDQISYAV